MRHRSALMVVVLIALLVTPLMSGPLPILDANGDDPFNSSRSVPAISSMVFEGAVTYKAPDLLYRAAAGDILPERPGLEVASCSRNGVVSVTYGSDLTWTSETAWRSTFGDNPNDPANVYSIAVADILLDRPGDEIVTVDMDDSVELIWKDGPTWKHETIFRDMEPAQQMWLYEVVVGELPGTPQGPDIISVGDAGRTFVTYREGSKWTTKKVFEDIAPLDTCIIGDILPEHDGNELAVGGKGGNIVVLRWDGTKYSPSAIAELGSNVMDLVLIDLEPDIPGSEVYSTTYSGGLYMTYREEGTWRTERVHFEGAPIYGIEGGTVEGTMVISMATWNNRVALLYHYGGFKVKEIYRDDYLMMGTGIFDMDPYHQDKEVVGLSYYGRLHMFFHDDPKADIIMPFQECVASVNETVSVPFLIRMKGGFQGVVDLSLTGSGATLSKSRLTGNGILELKFMAPPMPGAVMVTVTARTSVSTVIREVLFTVRGSGGSMDFDRHNVSQQVGSDRQVRGSIELLSDKDMGSPFVIDTSGVPMGLSLDLSESVCDPLGEPITLTYTLTAEPWLRPGRYLFFLKGSLLDGRVRAVGFDVIITEGSISDFMLILDEDRVTAPEGTRLEVGILLQSIAGFTDEVELSLPDKIEGIELTLSSSKVIPTSVVTLTIDVVGGPGPYFIRVVGTSRNITREDILRLDTIDREGTISISVAHNSTKLVRTDGTYKARIIVTLEPDLVPVTIEPMVIEGLPDGMEASVSPSDLKTIPYSVELTIDISSEKNLDGPITITINVTPEGSNHHYLADMTLLPYKEEHVKGDGRIPFAYYFFALMSAGIISGLIVLLLVKRRSSDRGEELVRRKGPGPSQTHFHHAETAERLNGIRRGPYRVDDRK